VKAFVLAAGLATRFRPVTERVPKALLRFLNVPLVRRRLSRLARLGVCEAAVNLHHEGRQIVEHLTQTPVPGIAVRFFREPEILGTAGGLKNAESFLEDEDFLVWNVDAELEFDLVGLSAAHRAASALATLLVAPNPDPSRFTPLSVSAGRVKAIGEDSSQPFLYTGVCVLSPRALRLLPAGRASLVPDLWQPALVEGMEAIAAVTHHGDFFDLGTPADFLAASLRALESRQDFEPAEGIFDRERKVLSRSSLEAGATVQYSVIGRCNLGRRATVRNSVLWDGADVPARAEVSGCLVGPVVLRAESRFSDALLWPSQAGGLEAQGLHGFHRASPAVK
jgi:NDP-sugar pyrophosphorylase family protein